MTNRRDKESTRPAFSLDMPGSAEANTTAEHNQERRRCASYTELLPPIPASPTATTASVAPDEPFVKTTNTSAATLACPPSSLHPSILQCLERSMAGRPVTPSSPTIRRGEAGADPSPTHEGGHLERGTVDKVSRRTSARPHRYSVQRSLYSSSHSLSDEASMMAGSDMTSLATASGWASVSSLGYGGIARQQRINSVGTLPPTTELNRYASNPIASNDGSNGTTSLSAGTFPSKSPGTRSDKSIRFWSRLRRFQSEKDHSDLVVTTLPRGHTMTNPESPSSPLPSSRGGWHTFSSNLASTLGGAAHHGSSHPGTMTKMAHGGRCKGYAPSTVDTTVNTPVKETSKVVKEYDPQTGNKMLNRYMIMADLGRGVHGKVKLARDTVTGQACAIKIVDKSVRRRYRMSQYGRMSRSGFGNLSPGLGPAGAANVIGIPGASDQPHLDKIRREIAILKKCRHPNVVRLIEVIDDPEARKIYLVLELLDGGEVRWKQPDADLPLLSQQDTRRIFRDVVLGLDYLHYQGIVHRDIKPANLLMTADSRTVKITDFGVSHLRAPRHGANGTGPMTRQPSHHTSSSDGSRGSAEEDEDDQRWADDEAELAKTVGSPAFFAPELCYTGGLSGAGDTLNGWATTTRASAGPSSETRRPSLSSQHGTTTAATTTTTTATTRPPVTKAIDVWALGVTLYCLVYGRCPFMAETEWELFNVIPRKELEFPDDVQVPPSLKDLIGRLLTKDPTARITLADVKRHPWVIADLPDPDQWRRATDPARYAQVDVTEDEVKQAVTIKDRIRDQIRRLSSTLGLRRRVKSPPAANVVMIAKPVDGAITSSSSVSGH